MASTPSNSIRPPTQRSWPITTPIISRELRANNKRELQLNVHLPIRNDVPVIGMVSRLETQKGIDLVIPALRRLLAESDVQFVALGAGDPRLSYEMGRLGSEFDWRARTFIGYNAEMAQHIYAGCDLFLMPSYFEPCGIGQMLAMRYGALPAGARNRRPGGYGYQL